MVKFAKDDDDWWRRGLQIFYDDDGNDVRGLCLVHPSDRSEHPTHADGNILFDTGKISKIAQILGAIESVTSSSSKRFFSGVFTRGRCALLSLLWVDNIPSADRGVGILQRWSIARLFVFPQLRFERKRRCGVTLLLLSYLTATTSNIDVIIHGSYSTP